MGLRSAMKVNYPGLLRERMTSGNYRYRVRVRGDKTQRIALSCNPDHEKFYEQYLAARSGIVPNPIQPEAEPGLKGSIGWLLDQYMQHFGGEVRSGLKSAKTLKKKRNLLSRLHPHSDKPMLIPSHHLERMRDELMDTPAQADAYIEAIRVMYAWAKKRKLVNENPAVGIDRIYVKGDGAEPWSARDIRRYLNHHKLGTKAHAAIHILLWTNCRIEDLTVLGRKHECVVEGVDAIRFQPSKKGASEVTVPLMPQLVKATRAQKVQGATYILGRGGRPYASGDSMSATFIKWCNDAGLIGKSAHGIRKGLGEFLAELGVSQYGIMAVHGHSEARTSEVYTRRVERWRLAKDAMEKVKVSHDF